MRSLAVEVPRAKLKFGARRFTIVLDDGRELSLPYKKFPLLARATPAERRAGKIAADGHLRWETIDEDLHLEDLLSPGRLRVPKGRL